MLETIWIRRLLSNLHFGDNLPTKIYEDNQGAIELSKNPKHHNRVKHIDISFHFVRERVASEDIEVIYCPTDEMVADAMTKALPKEKFLKFREIMGIDEI